jgi:glyoxylase-like metal-dependent hydrolase (beta-lactamase superfamily II)
MSSSPIQGYNVDYDFHRFQLENFACIALCDGAAQYSLESMVSSAPRSEVEAYLKAHNLPTEVIVTPYTYIYVDTGGHKILVDTGAGKLFPTTGRLLQSMDRAGIPTESVDSIFISHAHPDHVGGVLNDKGDLNFPNATYFICQNEWDFWFSEKAFDQVAETFIIFAREKLSPLKDRIVLLEEEKEVLPGVEALFAPGHTPGHMVISFKSKGERLLYTADTVLHPIHLEQPNWTPIFDIHPELAQVSKKRIFDLASETKSLVLGQHFPPFPNLGHIAKQEIGWIWQPIETEKMNSKLL